MSLKIMRPFQVILAAVLCICMPAGVHAQTIEPATIEPEAPFVEQQTKPVQPTPSISSYRINPGDELEIYVWGEERLQRVLRVLPDGTIAFPLVGQLLVAGSMPQDVEAKVRDRLKDQYRGEVPFVTVSVREAAGMQFSVMGKVKAPGSYSAGRYINLLEALSMAGGPAEFASLDSVLVIREQGEKTFSTTISLAKLFRSGASTSDVEKAGIVKILPGDVIIVP